MCYKSEPPGTPLLHVVLQLLHELLPPSNSLLSGFAWLTRQLQLAAQAPSASFRNLSGMQRKLS